MPSGSAFSSASGTNPLPDGIRARKRKNAKNTKTQCNNTTSPPTASASATPSPTTPPAPLQEPPQIPENLLDPISLSMFRDPVVIVSGRTFDRATITACFERQPLICPLTRQQLDTARLITDWGKRGDCERFLDEHPDFVPDGWATRELAPPRFFEDRRDQGERRAGEQDRPEAPGGVSRGSIKNLIMGILIGFILGQITVVFVLRAVLQPHLASISKMKQHLQVTAQEHSPTSSCTVFRPNLVSVTPVQLPNGAVIHATNEYGSHISFGDGHLIDYDFVKSGEVLQGKTFMPSRWLETLVRYVYLPSESLAFFEDLSGRVAAPHLLPPDPPCHSVSTHGALQLSMGIGARFRGSTASSFWPSRVMGMVPRLEVVTTIVENGNSQEFRIELLNVLAVERLPVPLHIGGTNSDTARRANWSTVVFNLGAHREAARTGAPSPETPRTFFNHADEWESFDLRLELFPEEYRNHPYWNEIQAGRYYYPAPQAWKDRNLARYPGWTTSWHDIQASLDEYRRSWNDKTLGQEEERDWGMMKLSDWRMEE